MKAGIRAKIEAARAGKPAMQTEPATVGEEYFTADEVAARLKLHRDTVKELFRNETEGVIRLGNRISNHYRRRYVTERYSASAVARIERRLLSGDDPRLRKD